MIDESLTTFSAGFAGLRPLTLLGRRFELPVIWTNSALVIESFIVVESVSGSVIRLIPNFPIPLLAISLPQCGRRTDTKHGGESGQIVRVKEVKSGLFPIVARSDGANYFHHEQISWPLVVRDLGRKVGGERLNPSLDRRV